MLTSDIIKRFELYVDDMTELSSQEELDLANKIYSQICDDRPWEFLKKAATGTTSTSVSYITAPSDFAYFSENKQATDNTRAYDGVSAPRVIFVGSTYREYKVINFSDRRQYRDQDGYVYYDAAQGRIYFTKQPTSADTYEFDYISAPTALTLATSPAFPERYQHAIYHGMAIDDDIIQRFEKARSYAGENAARYNKYLTDMRYWNAKLLNN